MDMFTRDGARRQRVGGMAALYLALAFLWAIPYFVLVVDYQGANGAAEKLALVADNYASMYGMYLLTYVLFGIALAPLIFALYDRLRVHAPATVRVATTVGLLWSSVLVASGMIFTHGMTSITALAETDPEQAQAVWAAIEPIAQGLGGAGGEILGGTWVLMVSWVALRSGTLPKALGALGCIVGAAGLVSVAPPLHSAAYVFGLLLIAWFLWIGVVLLGSKAVESLEPTRPLRADETRAEVLQAQIPLATRGWS